MAINTSVTLGSSEAEGIVPVPLTVTIENGSGEQIFVQGITLLNDNGAVTVGDFQQFYPVTYQVVSGGTAVTSSIPKWGTGDQSTKTIVGSPLVYWIGNVSGSQLSASSFTGLHIPSGSQTIADGATGSFQSSIIPVTAPFLPSEIITTNIATLVVVSGSTSGSQSITSSAESFDIRSKPIERVACSLVGASAITSKSTWGRPPAFYDFDAYVQTDIVYTDGTQITLDPNNSNGGIVQDFSSSNPSVVSVIQSGQFGAITGSLGNPQITAGAGALTFTFPTNGPSIDFVTIENRLGPTVTGSVEIGLQEVAILGMFIQPNLVSIVSGTTLDLNAYYVLDNGQTVEAADPIGQPVWATSNSAAVAVSVSGSITGSADVQAQVTITAAEPNLGQLSSATVILNKLT